MIVEQGSDFYYHELYTYIYHFMFVSMFLCCFTPIREICHSSRDVTSCSWSATNCYMCMALEGSWPCQRLTWHGISVFEGISERPMTFISKAGSWQRNSHYLICVKIRMFCAVSGSTLEPGTSQWRSEHSNHSSSRICSNVEIVI